MLNTRWTTPGTGATRREILEWLAAHRHTPFLLPVIADHMDSRTNLLILDPNKPPLDYDRERAMCALATRAA